MSGILEGTLALPEAVYSPLGAPILPQLFPCTLLLSSYLFYFCSLELITDSPQALPFDSLEAVLEIKNKYPKLTFPQGYVLASG